MDIKRGRFNNHAKYIYDVLCREYGVLQLHKDNNINNGEYFTALVDFLLSCNEIDKVLDVIELSFYRINKKDAIKELNERFIEHGIGYQFESGKIIRIDSQFLHN